MGSGASAVEVAVELGRDGRLLVGDYYVVTEAEPGGEFVAGFGDADLAVAFAITEAAEGRHLAVISSATGECLYTNLPDLSHTTPPRNSMLRVRPSPRSED